MISKILVGLLLIFSVMKFYKNRQLFKQLTKKEWLQYIAGFLGALAVAIIIIFGGVNLTEQFENVWYSKMVAIVFILIALALAGIIMKKMLPKKSNDFY